ncbi:MAG TPA: trypsin-like peptidase domain-containing protein [Gemmatimonadaceae bacterium]|nr:trypsin-like peptidase domain-containing protein [Gemmatimonadaceae bacterium]
MKRNRAIALLVASAAIGGCKNDVLPAAQATQLPAGQTDQISAGRRTAITAAVQRVAPSVVTVQTEVVERVPADVFEQFFGGRSGTRSAAGLGSGFIVREDGVILTNAHVVSGASKISVAMRDGKTYPAKLLGADETNDLAVIKIDAKGLPVSPLGSSTNLLVGEWAIAIGNPYGFLLANTEPSVTAGVVSGTGRNLATESEGSGVYVDMIQTDASINPGNSGGPLVNALGEVIGVNSSIYSPSGGSIGLGFAIPINRARRVTEDLLAHGIVRRPWIGIKLQMGNAVTARDLVSQGVIVSSVVPGSPADRAGIKPGDVLVQSRQRALHNPYDWEAERLELRVGEDVPLVIRRGDQDLKLNVRVADLPEVNAPKVTVLKEIQLVTLTPAIRAERNIRRVSGALVQSVSQRVAEQLGIQAGDVILQVNRVPIADAQSAARALDYYAGRSAIVMYLERNGQVFTTEFVIQ